MRLKPLLACAASVLAASATFAAAGTASAAGGSTQPANVSDFLDTAVLVAEDRSRVVIDLRGVKFFGTAGVSALRTLGERYAAGDTPWAVVPSRNVDRVMRICDTEAVVPLEASVDAAFASM